MGCPHVYYKQALQYFAHCLVFMENEKLAKEMSEEKSEEKLENFISEKKKEMKEKRFYYEAGRTSQCVLEEAERESCDPLNAAISGIDMFQDFIGMREDLEE